MSINATPEDLRLATAALGRASLFDAKFSKPDAGMAAAWAEALAPHKLDIGDILQAVTDHYTDFERSMMVSDLIRRARDRRRQRGERDTADDRDERNHAQERRLRIVRDNEREDPYAAGRALSSVFTRIGVEGKAIKPAYDIGEAITYGCPTCQAPPDKPCVSAITGREQKVPHLRRTKDDRS